MDVKQRRILIVAPLPCIIFVFAATAALGADKPRWWERDDVRRQLHLTTSQIASIDDIFNDGPADRAVRRRELARLEEELHTFLRNGDTQYIEGTHLVDRIEDLRMQVNVTRTLMLIRIYRVPSAEQRAILDTLELPPLDS